MRHIVFIGGDRRELIVIKRMLEAGWKVSAFALPEVALPPKAVVIDDLPAALTSADACVLPLPPLHKDGRIYSLLEEPVFLADDVFAAAQPGLPIITGIVTPYLTSIAPRCVCVGLLNSDELAVPLADATAEGAIAEAIRLSPHLLCGAPALIVGFGRIGRALAWRLDALGMEVTVVNRSASRANEARDFGYRVEEWSSLSTLAAQSLYLFNTAPALVFGREQIQWIARESLIIDLAANPGGTDFSAAAELGVKAVLCGGLPGKYTPAYAGEVMATAYQRRLHLLLDEGD
jgi:dipicolinate synthase subunit A